MTDYEKYEDDPPLMLEKYREDIKINYGSSVEKLLLLYNTIKKTVNEDIEAGDLRNLLFHIEIMSLYSVHKMAIISYAFKRICECIKSMEQLNDMIKQFEKLELNLMNNSTINGLDDKINKIIEELVKKYNIEKVEKYPGDCELCWKMDDDTTSHSFKLEICKQCNEILNGDD